MSETGQTKSRWLRTRQSNVVGGRMHRHVVKLTDEQELAVQAAARVQGVTVARLLADSALKAPRASVSREDLTELFAVTKLIAAVGRNLNQLAKVANATGEVPPETAAAVDAVRRVFDRIERLPRDLVGR
nr:MULTISPECIES: plasmid mobilization relaxosome protein MobC [unclassified Rhodococcus (in: high G+C Gram-positive bacteria)]